MAQERYRWFNIRQRNALTRGVASISFVVALCALVAAAAPSFASKVRAFRAAEASDFLAGELDGVSVGPLGKLRLASALEKVAGVEEPFMLSAARDGRGGWVLGTGNSGKVLHVSSTGVVRELFATEEPEVFAVWVDGDRVYAAGSPDARVYHSSLDQSTTEATMILDTGERYVWALGRELGADASGRLLVATGINGKLLAFDETSERSEVVYDSADAHLRTLLVRDDDVLVGTVGEGRILSLKAHGTAPWAARTLHDAAQPEITSLTPGPNGSVFAAAVASEASLAQLPTPATADGDSNGAATPAAGTRPSGFEGARSVVLEIDADGTVEERGSFKKETVYSVLWTGNDETGGQLWIATGQEGKLYRSHGSEVVLERDLDELQLMQLLGLDGGQGAGFSIATTNGAAVYRTSDRQLTEGVYSSKVLDAKFPSRFGTLHYEAALSRGSSVAFAARSGLSAFPDDTWSAWVNVEQAPGAAAQGALPDLDLTAVPRGRYVQWKATLERGNGRNASDVGPELSMVELTYEQENRRPEITKLEVLSPGVVLVGSSFNPSNQVFEPTNTNRDGIFTSLEKPAEDKKSRSKELWKLGYRTIKWEVKDPNDDELRYAVALRSETETRWYTIADEITQTSWGFDSTVLPDGLYRVRLAADDGLSNAKGRKREAERVSGIVVIDHTAPVLKEQVVITDHRVAVPEQQKPASEWKHLVLSVEDQLSPIRKIEVSRDAGEWQELIPNDGMLDSRRETVTVETPAGDARAGLLLLRMSDAAFNSTVIQLQVP